MEISKFTRDEDKYEINPMEWLRLVKEYDMTPTQVRNYFFGDAWKWWMNINQDTNGTAHGKNLKNSSQTNGLRI